MGENGNGSDLCKPRSGFVALKEGRDLTRHQAHHRSNPSNGFLDFGRLGAPGDIPARLGLSRGFGAARADIWRRTRRRRHREDSVENVCEEAE